MKKIRIGFDTTLGQPLEFLDIDLIGATAIVVDSIPADFHIGCAVTNRTPIKIGGKLKLHLPGGYHTELPWPILSVVDRDLIL